MAAQKAIMRQSQHDASDQLQSLSRSRSIESTFSNSPPYISNASPLTDVSPDPAYIAVSAASQIVTSDHEAFFQTLCDEGIVKHGSPIIMLTPQALRLINQFLDYLLWSFLAAARSTSMKTLRPAVNEVLRNRLAKEAILGAEAELEEYLGDGDDDDLYALDESAEDFDLERSWKKTRLRCMVYSSLGDMEEDDEDAYSEVDYPNGTANSIGSKSTSTVNQLPLSPAVAIFLTSILEFVGEQTLLVAGNATVTRFSQARITAAAAVEDGEEPESLPVDRPVVEELDAEKVALNPILGRMWRQWRKAVRSPDSVRAPSREAFSRRGSQRASRRTSSQSIQSVQSMQSAKAIIDPEDYSPRHELRNDVRDSYFEHDNEVTSRPNSILSKDFSSRPSSITKDLVSSRSFDNSLPSPPPTALRRLTSDEKLLAVPLPLTPILEAPSVLDSKGRKRLTLTLGSEIAEDGGQPFLVPNHDDSYRPSSMPSKSTNFIFPFVPANLPTKYKTTESVQTPPFERPTYGRVRSNSLPLPGAFPISPNDLAFRKSSLFIDPTSEDMSTPHARPVSHGLEVEERLSKLDDIAVGTDAETTDAEYETDVSLHSPLLVGGNLHGVFKRPSTQVLEAQSIRIIANKTPPGMLRYKDIRLSGETNGMMESDVNPSTAAQQGTAGIVIKINNDLDEDIGIAKTSDLFVPPTTSEAAPIFANIMAIRADMLNSYHSDEESEKSSADIARQRRRKSRFYVPPPVVDNAIQAEAPLPTEDKSNFTSSPNDVIPTTRELRDLIDPVTPSDDEQVPAKRITLAPTKSLSRTVSPIIIAQSPTSPRSFMSASTSSESLSQRSISSTSRSMDKHSIPTPDLPNGYVRTRSRGKSSPTDRAGVRTWTPPTTPDATRGKRSASFGKGHKPSGSISSQSSSKFRNIITGRPPTSDGRVSSRHGGSDNDSIYSESHSAIVAKMDEKQKSFEQLIQSGATLQYTLTPETLMKMDLPGSKTDIDRPRTATIDLAEFLKESAPPQSPSRPSTALSRRSSAPKSKPQSRQRNQEMSVITNGTPNVPASLNENTPLLLSKNINEENVPIPIPEKDVRRLRTADSKQSPVMPIVTNFQSVPPRKIERGTNTIVKDDRTEAVYSRNGTKRYVAREASASTKDESTSELIDFFRNTAPPKDVNEGPRIPRTVAPFRTTMDSERSEISPRPRQDSLASSSSPDMNTTSTTNRSYPSSYASHTELIKKNDRIEFAPQVKTTSQNKPGMHAQQTAPTRKQSRVKDPYAIDSDDEDGELFATPKPARREEESLMDFLKNVPPPPKVPSEPMPFVDTKTLHKKSSGVNLIGRFGRSNPSASPTKHAKLTKSPTSAFIAHKMEPPVLPKMSPQLGFAASVNDTINARRPPSRPLPVKAVPVDYVEPKPQMVKKPSMSRDGSFKKTIGQARGARTNSESIDGLADFLRYTGPPPSIDHVVMPPIPQSGGEDHGNKSKWKLSSRKNRSIAA